MAKTGYSRLQIRLHWTVVGLVTLMFVMHDGIANAFDAGMDSGMLQISPPVIGHFVGGALILFLTMWRFQIRNEQGVPPASDGEPALFARLSKIAHLAFYVILFLLPMTGAVAWGNASAQASFAHEILRAVLFFLIIGHVGAVLIHQIIWKTGVITRMIRPDG